MKRLARVGVGMLLGGCSSQAVPDEPVAEVESKLWMSGQPHPDKTARICWDEASRARADFVDFAANTESAAMRSWTQATGLMVTDWGACPEDTTGMIVGHMQSSGQSSCGPVSYTATGHNSLKISPGGAPIMHELGHCLGFAHEYNAACTKGLNNGNLGTPLDYYSVMAGMGYCTSAHRISYWDEIGAQKVYGFPNLFADVTGDGKADALVVDKDCLGQSAMWVRPANSAGTSFGTPAKWTPAGTDGYGDKGTFVADVTGDKRADLITVNDEWIVVAKSNGSAFQAGKRWTLGPAWGTRETHFADVTGDCKADAIFINDSETYVRNANAAATGFGDAGVFGPSRVSMRERTAFANVSHAGAGRGCWADAIYIDVDGIWVAKTNGSSFEAAVNWTGGAPVIGSRATHIVDVTGDGLADAVAIHNDQVVVYRSTGDSFAEGEIWSNTGLWGARGVFPGDMNGDGKADLAMIGNDRIRVAKSTGIAFPSYTFFTSSPWYGTEILPACEIR